MSPGPGHSTPDNRLPDRSPLGQTPPEKSPPGQVTPDKRPLLAKYLCQCSLFLCLLCVIADNEIFNMTNNVN